MKNSQRLGSSGQFRLLMIPAVVLLCTECNQNSTPEAVAPQNISMKNSPRIASNEINPGRLTATVEAVCYWNDKKYSDGAQVCESHQRSKCWNGKWVDIGQC